MSRADPRGMTGRDVIVVVLNWNGGRDTLACLESLAAAELRGASVLVVDNGSRDGSVRGDPRALSPQRVLALPENRGYAGGNNAGMRGGARARRRRRAAAQQRHRASPPTSCRRCSPP